MTTTIDLSPLVRSIGQIADNIEVVNSNLAVVHGKVDAIGQVQAATKYRVEQLYQEFATFVAADVKHKERQFAATRIIEVRQEIEKRFGHFAEVRRTTTGILQATDVAIVREETMRTATENLMLSAPGYWLAPALVALTAWIGDNKSLAERALAEALRRDDSKTSLFFALISRRARRLAAATKWLRRYFQIQSPMAMDREVVAMLDALANGVFGGAALTECSTVVEQWLAELEQQAGFLEEQRKRWTERLDVLTPKVPSDEYPTLRKYSPTWPRLEISLAAARRNQTVYSFFEQLFSGEIIVPPSLEVAVDGLLDSLVTNFDDQELPLRRQERMLQLVVEEQGDRDAAARRLQAETEVFEEKTNFAAMLTNSAMNPEQFGATRATQRYAISRSRQWILAAYQDLVGRDRAQVPAEGDLTCGSWKGKSTDGSNEPPLNSDLIQHYASRIEQAVKAVKLTAGSWIVLAGGVLLGLGTLVKEAWFIGLVIAGAAGAYFYWQYRKVGTVRQSVRQELEKERDEASRVLKASLAELVDLRREIATEEGKSAKVTEFLQALSSPQFVLQRPEQARATAA